MDRHARNRYPLLLSLVALVVAPARSQDFTVLDVPGVPANGDPLRAVLHVHAGPNPEELSCDVLVAGAGMGGVAAALTAAGRGHSVCLTDETDWVGGQATSGGVPALDENRFIEFAGGTRSYYQFRNGIREAYRTNYRLTEAAARWENLNPGSCYVSPLCFEPRVGEAVLREMLKNGKIELLPRTKVLMLSREGSRIEGALAWRFEKHAAIRIRTRFVLDATETGELLPLAKVAYVAGSEAKADTGEADAAEQPNRACVQSFTYPFAVERRDGEQHRIVLPPDYQAIVKRQAFTLQIDYPAELGWEGLVRYRMFGEDPPVPNNMSPGPFFPWRRLLAAANFVSGVPHDIALMNWPRQDYATESIWIARRRSTARILQRRNRPRWLSSTGCRTISHETNGSGCGYPELMLRPDVMQTADGMSKYPYIRESRRIWRKAGWPSRTSSTRYSTWAARQMAGGFGRRRLLHGGYPPVRGRRTRAHDDAAAVSGADGRYCCRAIPWKTFSGGKESRCDALNQWSVPVAPY